MDIGKWILSGLKQLAYLFVGAIITLGIDFLTASIGFKPAPGLQEWLWANGLYPAIVTAIAMLKNWLQHRKA